MAHHSFVRSIATAGLVAGALSLAGGSALASTGDWSYGDTGSWGETCTSGQEQSPINLVRTPPTVRESLPNPVLRYRTAKAEVENNGHSIEAVLPKGSTMRVNGTTYELDQFHFHAPSEHTVNGVHYPVELHLVNKSEDGAVSVIAVFAKEGKHTNVAWQPYIKAAKSLTHEGDLKEHVKIDVRALAPRASASYRYDGSLTTPACTQGVTWIVLATPVKLSHKQITVLENVPLAAEPANMGNNRPVQELNGRAVTFDFSKGFGAR